MSSEATSEKEHEGQEKQTGRWHDVKKYGFGLALGWAATLYGVIALLVGKTYLPGLAGNDHTLSDQTGTALAGGYLAGGLFLILRLYVEDRVNTENGWKNIYFVENALLLALIGCLAYVLLHVGSAH